MKLGELKIVHVNINLWQCKKEGLKFVSCDNRNVFNNFTYPGSEISKGTFKLRINMLDQHIFQLHLVYFALKKTFITSTIQLKITGNTWTGTQFIIFITTVCGIRINNIILPLITHQLMFQSYEEHHPFGEDPSALLEG